MGKKREFLLICMTRANNRYTYICNSSLFIFFGRAGRVSDCVCCCGWGGGLNFSNVDWGGEGLKNVMRSGRGPLTFLSQSVCYAVASLPFLNKQGG